MLLYLVTVSLQLRIEIKYIKSFNVLKCLFALSFLTDLPAFINIYFNSTDFIRPESRKELPACKN